MKNDDALQAPLEALIHMLKSHLDMDLWMVTRVLEDDWLIVAASENSYGVTAGDVLPWRESVCSRMVEENGPNIVSDIQNRISYKEAPIVKKLPISAYVGFPIVNENSELLGTLCAIDQSTRPESIKSSDQFIKSLLHVTEHIINQHDTINRLENALDKFSEQSSIDDVTGLPNQDSFFHAADAHKEKYGPLNAPIAVLIIDIGGVILKSKTSDLNYKDLMRALSVAMSKLLRETDSLYKLDGSRFAMLLINVDTKFVSAMVMKISKHLEPFNLKVSIGADVCREGQSMSKSIEQANNNKLI